MKPGLLIRSVVSVLALPVMVAGVVPGWLTSTRGVEIGFGLPMPLNMVMTAAGLAIMVAGLWLAAGTIRMFATAGEGTLAPWDPPRKLVARGIYRYVRNPMISGVLAILLGEGILLGSVAILEWFAIFLALNSVYIPLSEEPALAARFGQDYLLYKRHVPRWIPRFTPWEPDNR
ncbi:MAG TPA: isoprenylcysteine carboxylmethyltransferase family protein [Candidatus Binataceae bacterium]